MILTTLSNLFDSLAFFNFCDAEEFLSPLTSESRQATSVSILVDSATSTSWISSLHFQSVENLLPNLPQFVAQLASLSWPGSHNPCKSSVHRVSHTVFDTLRPFLSLHFTWTGETYHTWLCVGPPGNLRHTTKDIHRWAFHEAQPSWIVFTKTRQLSTPYDSFRHPLILACWGSDLSHFALFNWYLTCDGIKYVLN